MFTGIIEEAGAVESVENSGRSIRLVVRAAACAKGLRLGDSIAVNGCCLTAAKLVRKKSGASVHFDLLHETWQRTNLQFARPGSLVNLERPLSVNGRLDGHFVTGHIDGIGRITRAESRGSDRLLEISADTSLMPLIVSKGSIALDGISLTIADLGRNHFSVWIIPHTWEVTALRERKTGDAVNLEMDILGKYVARFMKTGFGKSPRKSN
jgi:riboflavin synthase